MTTPSGPATQSTANLAGGPYGAWSGTNSTGIIGPAGVLLSLGGGAGGGVALYDGANSITSGTAQFSNANGVSFGFNGQTVTASVAAAVGQTVQTQASGAIAGTGFTSTSTGGVVLVGTNNTSGLSVGVPNWITTWTVPGATVFSNSNNVSFGLAGSTITATATLPLQTGISGIQVSNTTYTSGTVVWVNSNGISFGSSGANSITASYTVPTVTNSSWTVSDAATSGTVGRLAFTNLNGVTLSLSTGAGGSHTIVGSHNALTSQSNQAFSAQGGSSAFQTLAFTNSNNISFSNTAGSVWGSFGLNVSATGGTSNALSGLTFQDSNGVSFGLSTGAGVGTLTATIASTYAGTGVTFGSSTMGFAATLNTSGLSFRVPYVSRYIWPEHQLTPINAPTNASQSIQYMPFQGNMFLSRIDALLSLSAASAAVSNTAGFAFSMYCGIYSRNGSTLSSIQTGSTQTTYTYASNSAGATYLTQGGLYAFTCPLNASTALSAGDYWIGYNLVTNTTSIGANTTNLGLTLSMMGGNQIQTALNYNEFGATATSTNLYGGMGVYSAATTGIVTRVSLSAINQTGANLAAGNFAVVLRSA